MPHYIVTYDLNRPGQNYDGVIKVLGSYRDHWNYQKSSWIVGPAPDAFTVAESVRPHLDVEDNLMVSRLTTDCAWVGFGDRGDDWIRAILQMEGR